MHRNNVAAITRPQLQPPALTRGPGSKDACHWKLERHTHTHTIRHTHTHTHTHTHMHTHPTTHTQIYTLTYALTQPHTHTHTDIHNTLSHTSKIGCHRDEHESVMETLTCK